MKFCPGLVFEHAGVVYKVREGKNAPGDMIISFTAPPDYTPTIAHTLILFEFKCQVEDNNYPPPLLGWKKLHQALLDARTVGWEKIAEMIKQERIRKRSYGR